MQAERRVERTKIFRMGSCRIFLIPDENQADFEFINEPIGHTHTLKEHIQLVKFLRGDLTIPSDLLKYIYTFYGGDQKRADIDKVLEGNRQTIDQADAYLVEVCSLKILCYGDIFFQLSRFTKSERWNIEKPSEELSGNTRIYVQDEDEFHRDFRMLVELLHDKPIIFTGHIDVQTENGDYIPGRAQINQMLKKYACVHGKHYYDLSEDVGKNREKYVQQDLTHLKEAAFRLASQRIAGIVTGQPVPRASQMSRSKEIPSLFKMLRKRASAVLGARK